MTNLACNLEVLRSCVQHIEPRLTLESTLDVSRSGYIGENITTRVEVRASNLDSVLSSLETNFHGRSVKDQFRISVPVITLIVEVLQVLSMSRVDPDQIVVSRRCRARKSEIDRISRSVNSKLSRLLLILEAILNSIHQSIIQITEVFVICTPLSSVVLIVENTLRCLRDA